VKGKTPEVYLKMAVSEKNTPNSSEARGVESASETQALKQYL
jgi:hypothetical protein